MERSEHDTKFAFSFQSEKQALKAAKRLQEALVRFGQDKKSLSWTKNILSWVCGQEDYKALISGDGASVIDQDVADVDFLLERRSHQSRILAKAAKLDCDVAGDIVHLAEPSGLGGVFRFCDVDTNPLVQYVFPVFQKLDGGAFSPFIPTAQADDSFGLAHIAYDEIFLFTGDRRSEITLEVGNQDIEGARSISVRTDGQLVCSFMLERKAFGSLYEDEPRILRPTEIESLQLHWSLSEFELQDGMEEEVAVVVVSGLIATDMLQCASWCALAPRPAVIGDIEMRIESYEDNRQMSMQIAQTAAQGIDATVELQREMFLDDSFEDDGWSIGLIAMKVQEVEVED